MNYTATHRATGALLEALSGPAALAAARTAITEVAKRDSAAMGALRPMVHHFGDRLVIDLPATQVSVEVEIESGEEAAAILHHIHVWEPRTVDHTAPAVADARLALFA
jgi:hypothetical protein